MIRTDERKYVETLLGTGDFSIKVRQDIDILSRFYIEEGLYSKEEIVNLIISFMESNVDGFLKPMWIETVEGIVNKNFKEGRGLVVIESIPVKKKEIDTIKTLETKEERYLLFTLIVLARFKNYSTKGRSNNWVNYPLSAIFKIANLRSLSITNQCSIVHNLKTLGLISLAKACDNLSLRVECLADEEEDEVALGVYELDRLGVAYNNYIKVTEQGYKICESCREVVFKPKNNKEKYCKTCKKDKELEKYKRYNEKR